MKLSYQSDTKHRKSWFTGVSFSHPAKMTLPLQIWLIENYSKPGDVILDPMSGSGTILVACSMGRDVICIELEAKFIEIIKGNWQKIQERGPQMGYTMGKAQIIQGDARNLEGLLCDTIISSPPYEGSLDRWAGDNRNQLMEDKGLHAMPKADCIVTSPPYANQVTGEDGIDWSKGTRGKFEGNKPRDKSKEPGFNNLAIGGAGFKYSDSKANIGNLRYGKIDQIITSPPYTTDQCQNDLYKYAHNDGRAIRESPLPELDLSKNNLGNLKYGSIDAVISSPPYQSGGNHADQTGSWGGQNQALTKEQANYGQSEGQIGNLKSDSYLSAMLQVYQQCFAVLKAGGVMCLVTKNYIRNKQIVDLAADTIKLCESAGFTFQERHYRKLTAQSFWRVIYKQKYPDAPEINTEDILVFKKALSL